MAVDPLAEYAKPRPKRKHRRTAKGGIPQSNPFVEMLQDTLIEEILPKRTVIVLDDSNSVGEALQLLSKFQLLSAPVIDMKSQGFLGFLDMLDLNAYAASLYDQQGYSDDGNSHGKSEQLLSTPIREIIDFSHNNPVTKVQRNSPLFQCIGLFQKGVHRVAVANENGQIVNVISQSDVIRFLVPTMDQYVTLFDKTAEELGLGLLPPITIRDTEPTIKALQIIGRNRISALAVVDENGKLVGNLSASDLKGAVITDDDTGADPFGSLLLPVLSFLKQGGMSHFPAATCTLHTALNYILLRLIALKVHRLWVVDDSARPIGIISLTDVMKAIIDQKQADRKDVY